MKQYRNLTALVCTLICVLILTAIPTRADEVTEEYEREATLPESASLLLSTYDLERNVNAGIAELKQQADKEERILAKKRRKEEKQKEWEENHVRVPGYGVIITKTEYNYLCRIVQAEAGFMDEMSRRYVASVILNRRESPDFPDNIVSIVTQNDGSTWQFSPAAPDGTYWTCSVTDETRASVDAVLKSGDLTGGATYFLAKGATRYEKTVWFDSSLTHLFAFDGHDYYR